MKTLRRVLPLLLASVFAYGADISRDTGDAQLLFVDGMAQLHARQYGKAALTFQTLISVYPQSPLVRRAADEMRRSEAKDQAHCRTVRSIKFENAGAVAPGEILARFDEREVGLAIDSRYDRWRLDEATSVLTELLEEKGTSNPRVRVTTQALRGHAVAVTFSVR